MEWSQILTFATQFRQALHANPEVTWAETNTAKTIREHLTKHGITCKACAGTGTVATLAPNAPGKHIALRADIDALPIIESTNLPYASTTSGVMHACGHDGHTATLMATALYLKHMESSLPGPVTLLFQPAEEGGHGAKAMIEAGCLEGVEAIYGWHNWPAIPFGEAICPDGVVMAGNGTFRIAITGQGGHSSQPELCRDPVLAASAITLALQQIVSRHLPPQEAAVISVTSIDARSGLTTIPQTAVLEGSIRVPNEHIRNTIEQSIQTVATQTAQAYGVKAEVINSRRYGATINHPLEAHEVREVLRDVLGETYQASLLSPIMASEDFSYYLEAIPGAFMLIGSDDGLGHDAPCHSPFYDFNDRLIEPVSKVLIKLATNSNPRSQ